MWTSINKKLYIFISIILAIGILAGVIFIITLDESTKEIIFLNINEHIQNFSNTKINFIASHLIILSSLLVLSLLVVGAPILIFFIFFNGFSIGFTISSITSIFSVKGLFYSFIYTLISKGIYLFIGSILIITLLKITKTMISNFIYKKADSNELFRLIKKSLVCIIIILISDIILYFFGTSIINLFNFLLN